MVALGVIATAQEKEDRTLLSQEQMNAIINEASGERAMHNVLDLVPYQFVRPPSEYQGHFRESEVMAAKAREYGFSNVTIEDYPTGQTWQPTVGELWMTRPRAEKLYDLHDIPESVASTNANADIAGDLISVGQGTAEEFQAKDVKGKFVLSLAPNGLAGVYQRAVAAGAIGALGISAIGAGDRAVDYPNEIVWTTVTAQPNTAAWALSPKTARKLETLLDRGQTVTIHSINKAEQVPNKQEIVHAEIPGDGSTTQEVAIGGHLFEGYIKQGANDDNSGCALTLEVGRAYLKLIKEGKLPRPTRTVNFQWVQEISGTNAWFTAHPEKAKNIIGDLNFDMEALRLTMSRSYWIMQRTPDTFPSYINDIGQSMMEYVSELTRERVRYRANGYQPVFNITAPNGSDDAFYIKIDQHEVGAVHQRHRLVDPPEALHRQHRAEDLLPGQPHVRVDLVEDGRGDVPAVVERGGGRLAAGDQPGPGGRGLGQEAPDPLVLGLADQRPHVQVLVPGAGPDRRHAGGDPLHDLRPDRLLDQQPGAGVAVLPGVLGDRGDDRRDRHVQVGVGEDHVRGLAAQLQLDRHQVLRGGPHHGPAGDRGADEADVVDVAMPGERDPGLGAEPGDDVEHARRQPGLAGQLGQRERRQRGDLGRLEHHRVAGGERRGHVGRGEHGRHVPRDDTAQTPYGSGRCSRSSPAYGWAG